MLVLLLLSVTGSTRPGPADPSGGHGPANPSATTDRHGPVIDPRYYQELASLMDRRLSNAGFDEMKKTLEKTVDITNEKGKSPFLSRHKLQKSCNNEKVHPINIPRENEVAADDVDESEYYSVNMKPGQLREVKEEIMNREGITNEKDIQVRTVLGQIRKQQGFELIGARTPGTFSEDIRKIVAKLERHNHKFGKTSVCCTCGDGAGMNENFLHPINVTSYSSAIMSALMMNGTSSRQT